MCLLLMAVMFTLFTLHLAQPTLSACVPGDLPAAYVR